MANRDEKERQRRRYLRGAAREQESRENRRNARGSQHDERFDYDRQSIDLDPELADAPEPPPHQDPMRRRGRRRHKAPGAEHRPQRNSGTEVAAGVVIARHHHHFAVHRDGKGSRPPLTVRSRPGDDPLVVGDRVSLGVDEGDGAFLLLARLPRRTLLERTDPGDPRGHDRLALAANVDLLVGVQPLSRPRPGLVDRLAVAAAAAELGLLICIHKSDLLQRDDGLHAAVADITARARAAGAQVVHTACPPTDHDAIDVGDLRAAVGSRCAVLIGPSGAGKSSLANALVPGLDLATGDVRGDDGKGRHTTSAAGWFALPGGGALIDTPGVRAFGLQQPDAASLARAFPDLHALGAHCRFRDCRHAGEPDCAAAAAVDAGTLSESRLSAWRRITAAPEGAG